ncbi:MAG TPA: beta-ketoacyl-ACP synthase 3 [Solirubrobacteraceae bacterium]|nr:beta-ketoacyl-ACP synthase 3 [Solirubrobacteraceae bacterium]
MSAATPRLGEPRQSPPTAHAGIVGVGAALPGRIVSSAEVAERVGVAEEWIVKRTGIRARRYADPRASLAELAASAGREAIADAGIDASDVDLVLVASCSQDSIMPNAAPVVAELLGTPGAGAFDIGSACTGFIAALAAARGMLLTGAARNALLIGAEILSRHVDPADRNTAALFGDGAGAAVCSAGAPGRIGPVVLGSDGSNHALIRADRDSGILAMEGHDTFKQAVLRLAEATLAACESAATPLAAIDLFVYHQANVRILAALAERLGVPPEKVLDAIADVGNTSAASVPLALAHARREGLLRPGMRVLLAGAGAGFTWGASVVEWGIA